METIIPINTNANGNDTTMANLCNISNPPSIINTIANNACIIPHTILLEFFGFKSPLEVNMPSTYMAELADVIKKVNNKSIAIIENKNPPL